MAEREEWTPEQVAERMAEIVRRDKRLSHFAAVRMIRNNFGTEFLHRNKRRHWLIDRRVTDAFRKMTADDVVWMGSSDKAWRLRRKEDAPGRKAQHKAAWKRKQSS